MQHLVFRFWNINLKMELCHTFIMVKNESKVTTQVCDKIIIDVTKPGCHKQQMNNYMHETAKAVNPPACCKYDIYNGIIIIIFTVFVNLLVVTHIEKHRKQLVCKKVFIA